MNDRSTKIGSLTVLQAYFFLPAGPSAHGATVAGGEIFQPINNNVPFNLSHGEAS